MRRRWVTVTSLLGAFTVATLAYTWPIPAYLDSAYVYTRPSVMPINHADSYLTSWMLAWGGHALRTAPFRVFDANILYPIHDSLAFSEHMLGAVVQILPVDTIGRSPVVDHNVLLLLSFVLTGVGSALLLLRARDPGSVPAAVVHPRVGRAALPGARVDEQLPGRRDPGGARRRRGARSPAVAARPRGRGRAPGAHRARRLLADAVLRMGPSAQLRAVGGAHLGRRARTGGADPRAAPWEPGVAGSLHGALEPGLEPPRERPLRFRPGGALPTGRVLPVPRPRQPAPP